MPSLCFKLFSLASSSSSYFCFFSDDSLSFYSWLWWRENRICRDHEVLERNEPLRTVMERCCESEDSLRILVGGFFISDPKVRGYLKKPPQTNRRFMKCLPSQKKPKHYINIAMLILVFFFFGVFLWVMICLFPCDS